MVWILVVWSENGCRKLHFLVETGSGFGEPGGIPPPGVPPPPSRVQLLRRHL